MSRYSDLFLSVSHLPNHHANSLHNGRILGGNVRGLFGKTCQAFFDDPFPQFFNKTIITPKVIDNEEVKKNVLNLSEKELDRIFEITTDLCNIGCNFKFVNPIIYKQENKSK